MSRESKKFLAMILGVLLALGGCASSNTESGQSESRPPSPQPTKSPEDKFLDDMNSAFREQLNPGKSPIGDFWTYRTFTRSIVATGHEICTYLESHSYEKTAQQFKLSLPLPYPTDGDAMRFVDIAIDDLCPQHSSMTRTNSAPAPDTATSSETTVGDSPPRTVTETATQTVTAIPTSTLPFPSSAVAGPAPRVNNPGSVAAADTIDEVVQRMGGRTPESPFISYLWQNGFGYLEIERVWKDNNVVCVNRKSGVPPYQIISLLESRGYTAAEAQALVTAEASAIGSRVSGPTC